MGVADRAVLEDEGAHGVGQPPGLDRGRRLGRVERHREVDLAVVEQLMQRRPRGGIALALAPEMRLHRLQPVPKGRRRGREVALRNRALQDVRIGRQLDQDLLEERAADEVRRCRIGEASRIGLHPVEQGRHRARRLRHARRIVEKDELGHAPGRLKTLGRDREVDQGGGLALGVDVAKIRQRFGKGPEQQVLPFERGEILAVDPDQVDGAVAVAAGCLLGDDPADRLGGIGQLDVHELDAVALRDLLADPGDVGVDLLVAAPGVPVHGLAPGCGQGLVPGICPGRRRRHQHQRGDRQEAQHRSLPSAVLAGMQRPAQLHNER